MIILRITTPFNLIVPGLVSSLANRTQLPLHHFRWYFPWLIKNPHPSRGVGPGALVAKGDVGDAQNQGQETWQPLDMSWLQEEHLQLGNEGLAVDGPLPQMDTDSPWSWPANAVHALATRPANYNLCGRVCSPSNCCCIIEDLSRNTISIICHR